MTFNRSSFRRLKSDGRLYFRLTGAHRHPEIVCHDQRADQEQRSSGGADNVKWMHRLHGLDEGVFQEAERGIGAPHQALQNPRYPHRGDVENDSNGRDPEMPVDELETVKSLAVPQPWHHTIERAERDKSDPAQCA